MEHLKAENKIITNPSGLEIPTDFFDKYTIENENIVHSDTFIRIEHPHCAFFKSTQKSGDEQFERNTLYTPQGRIHLDKKANEEVEDKYVTKKEQLEILLFYLRDVQIKPSLNELSDKVEVVIMPMTPLCEFLSFAETKLFMNVMKEYDMEEKHIMSQFRRIYNEKLEVLFSKLEGKIKYAVYEDIDGIDLDEEILDRWHSYYIRKSRLLK